MNAHNRRCTDEFREDLSGSLGDQRRVAWRAVLATLASPMVRLHHLRNIRTQMLHDALGDLDGCNKGADDA